MVTRTFRCNIIKIVTPFSGAEKFYVFTKVLKMRMYGVPRLFLLKS